MKITINTTIEVFRAVVNQPSTKQPLHDLHGGYGIVVKTEKEMVLFFPQGPVSSVSVLESFISRLPQ